MSAHDTVIVPYQDGPYLVRGRFTLRDQAGQEIDLKRRTIALCRCGRSRMRPFCDGTHRAIGFEAPSGFEAGGRRPAGETGTEATAASLNGSNGPGVATQRVSELPVRVLDGLRRAQAGVEIAAEAPATAIAYQLLRAAESLLTAAYDLLEQRQRPFPDDKDPRAWTDPCLCLLGGALDALAQAAEKGADVAAPSAQVAALTRLISIEGGST